MPGTFGLGQALAPMQAFNIGRSSATDILELIDDKGGSIEPPIPARGPDGDACTTWFVAMGIFLSGKMVVSYAVPKMEKMTLDGVSFTYPSRPEVPVLKSVTLDIEIGKKVAFVGESGSGKSEGIPFDDCT